MTPDELKSLVLEVLRDIREEYEERTGGQGNRRFAALGVNTLRADERLKPFSYGRVRRALDALTDEYLIEKLWWSANKDTWLYVTGKDREEAKKLKQRKEARLQFTKDVAAFLQLDPDDVDVTTTGCVILPGYAIAQALGIDWPG